MFFRIMIIIITIIIIIIRYPPNTHLYIKTCVCIYIYIVSRYIHNQMGVPSSPKSKGPSSSRRSRSEGGQEAKASCSVRSGLFLDLLQVGLG